MEDNMKVVVTPQTDKVRIEYHEPTEYIYRGVDYKLNSTDAIIGLINKRGCAENTLIFYDVEGSDTGIQVVLDDTVQDRNKDTAAFKFIESDLMREWKELFNARQGVGQKDLIKYLKRRDPSEFVEPMMLQELMAIAQTLNIATVINFDSMYQNESNKEIAFKIKDAETSTKVPDMFQIQIPLYNESDLIVVMEVEIEVVKPTQEGQKAAFIFTCPKLPVYCKHAMKYEVEKIKTALPEFTVLAGRGW